MVPMAGHSFQWAARSPSGTKRRRVNGRIKCRKRHCSFSPPLHVHSPPLLLVVGRVSEGGRPSSTLEKIPDNLWEFPLNLDKCALLMSLAHSRPSFTADLKAVRQSRMELHSLRVGIFGKDTEYLLHSFHLRRNALQMWCRKLARENMMFARNLIVFEDFL